MKTKVFNYGTYPRDNDIVVNYLELISLNGDLLFTAVFEEDKDGDASKDWLYLIMKVRGVYFVQDTYRRYDLAGRSLSNIAAHCENWVAITLENAAQEKFIRKMEIRVFDELGLDTAPLIRAREIFLNKRAEEKRRENEEYEHRQKEAAAQREREESERLDKVKADFLAGKLIEAEDFLSIAKRDGYEIHIRTIGTIRKRLSSLRKNGEYYYRPIKGKRKPSTVGFGDALFGYVRFLENMNDK